MKAEEVAERLWPGPDPVNFCRRRAIGRISAFDQKLKVAVDLRSRIDPIIFEDVSRLWIHPTRTELRLVLLLAELRTAVGLLQEATDLLASARSENELCFYNERLLEREEKRRAEQD